MNTDYQLYVSNNCDGCIKVISALAEQNIEVATVNIDYDTIDLPFTPIILPALVRKNKIVGYGVKDILTHLKNVH